MYAFRVVPMLSIYWLACEGSVKLDTVDDLAQQYSNIFKTGNRNAASHLWVKFILDRADTLSAEKVETLFHGFCAISGSPIPDIPRTEFKVTLPRVGGGNVTGVTRHCCWPCICDATELVKVDTKKINTATGPKSFNFLVIGDPCLHEEELKTVYTDPFSGGQTTLAQDAPEVTCHNGKLTNAVYSDNGYPMIGMLFDAPAGAAPQEAMLGTLPSSEQVQANLISQDATWGFGKMCTERKKEGYNSGMGKIFHKVAIISPIATAGSGLMQKYESQMIAQSDSPFFALKCAAGVLLVIMGVGCIWLRVRSKTSKDDSHLSDAEMSTVE